MDQEMRVQIEGEDPIVRFVSNLRDTYSHAYLISPTPDWWHFAPKDHILNKSQGWKLHLSAIPTYAVSLLEAVAPVLIEQNVHWKVLLTLDRIRRASSPPSALSQLGKFITVYPETDEIAVNLAELLSEKTCRFSGPIIPSDFRYRGDSQVYYRYGGFEKQYFYDPRTSLRTFYILTPDGKKVLDERTTSPRCPEWANNPFPQLDQKTRQPLKGLFGRGFKVRGVLAQTIKGGVYVVSDASNTFILKEARFGTCPDEYERDTRDRLTNEFNILKKISHLQIAPRPIELFDADNNRYLLMEHLPGQTLRQYIKQGNFLGDSDLQHIRLICASLIDMVRQCHMEGLVLHDLTPNNVLVTTRGCRLIDLELAHLLSSDVHPFSCYTPGYISLGSEHSTRDAFSYDIYALGAVLFFILTGADPYLNETEDILPRIHEPLDSSTFLRDNSLKDFVATAIHFLTSRTLSKQEEHPSICSSSLSVPLVTPQLPVASESDPEPTLPFSHAQLMQNAIAIAEHLYNQVNWQHADAGWLWSVSQRAKLFYPGSFYGGATGIAYYLCEIAQVTGDPKYYLYASQIMDWVLTHHPLVSGETPLGLHFGCAGVPWILIMIAQGLEDKGYLDRAIDIANHIAQIPPSRLDHSHGAAGIGLMHLELFRHTGDCRQLAHAIHLGELLLEHRDFDAQGNATWREGERTMWGFAHGAAGIAYYLLALYSQTKDSSLKEVIDKTNKVLIQAATPTAHNQGLSWLKDTADKGPAWTHWCNGASGVGIYFLATARYLCDAELESVALKAAHAIRLSHGMTTFCQCHGLAGDGEYLLQAGRTLDHPEIIEAAYQVVRKLYVYRLSVDAVPGFVWSSETMEIDPGYMIGYCGIYGFLLRVFHADLPRPLLYTGW